MKENQKLFSFEADWEKLAKEVVFSCPKIKKERERDILFARFGLKGRPKTLQEIGNEYKITRERVRQVVKNSLNKIKKTCTSKELKECTEIIYKYIKENGGFVTTDSVFNRFANKTPGQKNGLIFITALSDKIHQSKASQSIKEGWQTNSKNAHKIQKISEKIIKTLEDHGEPLPLSDLVKKIKEKEIHVISALSASNSLMKTKNEMWGLAFWPSINPKSIKEKSKYILKKHGKPMHYHKLSEEVTRFDNKKVTKQSVHNELIKNKEFILVGRGLYALLEWGYEPGFVEDVIFLVLKEAGEPLHKDEIIKRVLEKRLVKSSTIIINLQKPKFKKVRKAIYTIN